MTLKEFELTKENHFVAMQYYMLMLNRTFLILMTDDYFIGILGNGMVSIEGGQDPATKEITKALAIKGDLTDPYSYLKTKYLNKVENDNLLNGEFLKRNKANFIINRNEIKNALYDPKKKWGMGYYPHDGKVYIETKNKRKYEFIILGNQSGQHIANLIMKQKTTASHT